MTSLKLDAFYWAKSGNVCAGNATVVQVSNIFGDDPDYWTLAVIGSDQHHMIGDFEIIGEIKPAADDPVRLAAE